MPPTDPRFLDSTLEQIETEFWAYYYQANPSGEEFEDDDFAEEMARLNAEREAAGDDWETVIEHSGDKA